MNAQEYSRYYDENFSIEDKIIFIDTFIRIKYSDSFNIINMWNEILSKYQFNIIKIERYQLGINKFIITFKDENFKTKAIKV